MTTAVPEKPAELEEALADPGKLPFKTKDELDAYIADYAQSVLKADKDIQRQVDEQVTATLAEMVKANGNIERPNMIEPVAGHRSAKYNSRAPGAALDALFDSPEDFLRCTWHGNRHPDALAKQNQIRNDYSSAVPADGGFLIPESLRSTLLETSLESAIVRPRATVVPMEAPRVPFPMIDQTSHASSVHGGMIGYWTEESAALTESQASFGRITLDAKKLTGYSEVPNELFSDSITSFSALLSRLWPQAIAWFEDVAFFSGTGVGEPLGFLNAPVTVSVAKETGQAATTIVWENIIKMYARLMPSSHGKAVWIANIDTFVELATMALSVGTGGSAIWLNNGVEGPPMTILGRPVIFTEKAMTVGSAGDISLVDLSYYLIGDRQQMVMSTSPHYKFQNDQTAVRIIERVDGRPWLNTAITPQQGANTLSPFVNIAVRA